MQGTGSTNKRRFLEAERVVYGTNTCHCVCQLPHSHQLTLGLGNTDQRQEHTDLEPGAVLFVVPPALALELARRQVLLEGARLVVEAEEQGLGHGPHQF